MGHGHNLDANTIAPWRLDESNEDTRGRTEPDSSAASRSLAVPSNGGVPGITDYEPIPGGFCRLFVGAPSAANAGLCFGRVTDAGSQELWTGSWTVECFVRADAFPPAGEWDPIVGHNGAVGAETAAHNCLGRVDVGLPRGADGRISSLRH